MATDCPNDATSTPATDAEGRRIEHILGVLATGVSHASALIRDLSASLERSKLATNEAVATLERARHGHRGTCAELERTRGEVARLERELDAKDAELAKFSILLTRARYALREDSIRMLLRQAIEDYDRAHPAHDQVVPETDGLQWPGP